MANIAEVAKQAGQFSTLLAAVEAAGLTSALTGDSKLTVFAPTDEAFGKLPEGTVTALLKDIPKLKSILTYHVVEGDVKAADVSKLERAKTLQGSDSRDRHHQRRSHQRRGDRSESRYRRRQRHHPRDRLGLATCLSFRSASKPCLSQPVDANLPLVWLARSRLFGW